MPNTTGSWTTGLQIGKYVFEEVNNFKYLCTNLSNINDNHEEIKERVTSENKSFYGFSRLMGSKILWKKSNNDYTE